MYRIGKRFTFEAGHRLPGLPSGHKCARQHGHSYTVELILAAERLTPPGFVTDFADLEPLRRHIDSMLDHRNLHEVLLVEPTTEQLARYLYEWCAAELCLPDGVRAEAVRVFETASTWAEHRPETLS
jgi:6-pyruvoyltetrahydropterin/6-carboxytetrahydropterin synthase